MMQKTPPLTPVPTQTEDIHPVATPFSEAPDQWATMWVSRITSIVGLGCLIVALVVWKFHEGHYRFLLALLTVSMFAAILHSYTFENGS